MIPSAQATSTSAAPPPLSGAVLSGYRCPGGAYDEMLDQSGAVRPAWTKFAGSLNALGSVELANRWDQAKRQIRDHGVTYNVYGDSGGSDRPWELDALPIVLPPRDWAALEAGLVQRAQLLNLVLADLYGPQTLLTSGVLPPELVFAHSGFLRPLHGVVLPHDCYLHFYGADVVRRADGGWSVFGDRTQAPSGAGYALENRIVLSRSLANIFHDCQVQRLAPFFMAMRDTLHRLAPRHRENPRIVLLTRGPHSINYFEDSYLARYLGYMLVEGGDLAVRQDSVYLKTLGGLLPVDVILRRMSDLDCDPLELNASSSQGVAGLAQAVRGGSVAVANALGSGLVETPAIMAFLPRICKQWLGEELRLPSVGTWWCGNDEGLAYVLNNLNRLVIKPALDRLGESPRFGDRMSQSELNDLAARIRARPSYYVGQERVVCSTAPLWNDRGLGRGQVVLRAYSVATEHSYTVMHGGLARVSVDDPVAGLSMHGSKDAWILSEGPVRPVSLLHPGGQAVELRRSGNDLPSRVADNMFWLGRQVERAESGVRLVRGMLSRLAGESEPGSMPELPLLLAVLADSGQAPHDFAIRGSKAQAQAAEQRLVQMLFDAERAGSLHWTINNLQRIASIVRDRISADSWRILSRVDEEFRLPAASGQFLVSDVLAVLNQLIINLSAFSGLGMESMTRTQGWRFLDMGRRLERAMQTVALLRRTTVRAVENEPPVLEALLEIADSSMTYRSRYLTTLQCAPVVDLLLTDETNPRSVAFQLSVLSDHVERLPRDHAAPLLSSEQRLVLNALTKVRLAEIDSLCECDRDLLRPQLDRLLADLAARLPDLSNAIVSRYLVHAGPSRQMSDIQPESAP